MNQTKTVVLVGMLLLICGCSTLPKGAPDTAVPLSDSTHLTDLSSRTVTMEMRDIPLNELLRYACMATGLRCVVCGNKIVIGSVEDVRFRGFAEIASEISLPQPAAALMEQIIIPEVSFQKKPAAKFFRWLLKEVHRHFPDAPPPEIVYCLPEHDPEDGIMNGLWEAQNHREESSFPHSLAAALPAIGGPEVYWTGKYLEPPESLGVRLVDCLPKFPPVEVQVAEMFWRDDPWNVPPNIIVPLIVIRRLDRPFLVIWPLGFAAQPAQLEEDMGKLFEDVSRDIKGQLERLQAVGELLAWTSRGRAGRAHLVESCPVLLINHGRWAYQLRLRQEAEPPSQGRLLFQVTRVEIPRESGNDKTDRDRTPARTGALPQHHSYGSVSGASADQAVESHGINNPSE